MSGTNGDTSTTHTQPISSVFDLDYKLVGELEDNTTPIDFMSRKAAILSKLLPNDFVLLGSLLKEVEIASAENRRPSPGRVAESANMTRQNLYKRLKNGHLRRAYTICLLSSPISKEEFFYNSRLALKKAYDENKTSVAQKIITTMGKAAKVFDEYVPRDNESIMSIDGRVEQLLLKMGMATPEKPVKDDESK